jgi:hypothetical protein
VSRQARVSLQEVRGKVAEQQAISAEARCERAARQPWGRRVRVQRRTVVASLAGVLAVAVVYLCALREASAVQAQSDSAAMALQGWAMAHRGGTRYEGLLAGAAVVSVIVAEATKTLIRAAGGWVLDGNGHQFVAGQALAGNVGGTLQDVLQLFSASPLGQPLGVAAVLVAIHLVLAGMVITGCWLALRRLFWSGDMVAVLLAAGITANLAAYTLLYVTGPATIQDIAPVFGMGPRWPAGCSAARWPAGGRPAAPVPPCRCWVRGPPWWCASAFRRW